MFFCDHTVSIDDLNIILAINDSDFHVKVKEILLILHDEPILDKNERPLPLYLSEWSLILYFNDIHHCYSYCINIRIVS